MTDIERCLAQLDRIAEVIEDTLGDDDSVQWPTYIREVAVELARVTRQPAGPTAAVDPVRESRIARARGLAQAITEVPNGVSLDSVRECATEIVELLGGQP